MKSRLLALCVMLTLVSGLVVFAGVAQASPAHPGGPSGGSGTFTGTIDGATYLIQVPTNWNRTLVLYSHGYVTPGSTNNAVDEPDAFTGGWLLANGYALAGSSYSQTGWAIQQAFHDQMALLDHFDQQFGKPARTIAWGDSLGGIITAGLIQLHPERFTAALPMCGVLAGGVGTWNAALDTQFAFRTLLASTTTLQLVNITDPSVNLGTAEAALGAAQMTPQGQARIALAAAMDDLPGWFSSATPEPAATDYATREYNQFLWEKYVDFPFVFDFRAELEARAGGNVSWNTGVNYSHQLDISVDQPEVQALYQQSGLNLNADLATLASTPRVHADPKAVSYLNKYITFNGDLDMPVLTMHTTGDGLVLNQQEQAYASVVGDAKDSELLRQVFVHRAGHCAFTPAETVTAFQTLIARVNTGRWGTSTDPTLMNTEATSLGTTFNIAPASFLSYAPAVFPRPFDAPDRDHGHGHERD